MLGSLRRRTDLGVFEKNECELWAFLLCFSLQIPCLWIIVSIRKTGCVLTGRLGVVTGRRKMKPNNMEMCHHCWAWPDLHPVIYAFSYRVLTQQTACLPWLWSNGWTFKHNARKWVSLLSAPNRCPSAPASMQQSYIESPLCVLGPVLATRSYQSHGS